MTIERIPIAHRQQWPDTAIARFEEKFEPEPNSGCWLWTGALVPDGYGSFRLTTFKSIKVHRFSWLLHRGPIPDGRHVLHKCDVRCCVNPEHLFLGDNNANVRDRVRKGRSARNYGEKSPTAKLNADRVRFIRSSRAPASDLAERFGVCGETIKRARRLEAWPHVS